MVGDETFLFFQLSVHVDVGDEAMVVDGIEGNVNLSVERIGARKGG